MIEESTAYTSGQNHHSRYFSGSAQEGGNVQKIWKFLKQSYQNCLIQKYRLAESTQFLKISLYTFLRDVIGSRTKNSNLGPDIRDHGLVLILSTVWIFLAFTDNFCCRQGNWIDNIFKIFYICIYIECSVIYITTM